MKYILSILVTLSFYIFLFFIGCNNQDENVNQNDYLFEKPQAIIAKMTRGINIGNTLEPPHVGDWNNKFIEEYFFDDYVEAGFNTVRVPIRWEKHTLEVPPYTVSETWLDTIEKVIDWGLERDLFIIINAHHDWWLVNNYNSLEVRNRFHSIWNQIAFRFKDKPPHLLFEIINEPHGMTKENVDELNKDILKIIREENPQRIVIYGGHSWSNSDHLLSARIPNDEYIVGYFHSYDPWDFAGKGNGIWGSDYDIERIKSKFNQVSQWSRKNNIPVMLSEFGAIHDCDYNSRMLHYFTYVKEALRNEIAFQAWDDGGKFKIYDRESRLWPEVKDILIHTYIDGPEKLKVHYINDTQAYLTWINNNDQCSKIIIEKKRNLLLFENIAELDSNINEYIDNSSGVVNATYRVISVCENSVRKYSNPFKVQR